MADIQTLLIGGQIAWPVSATAGAAKVQLLQGGTVGLGVRGIVLNPPEEQSKSARRVVDCSGKTITPGFVDCHTHLIYAGDRAGEFCQRLSGTSYAQIAKEGGGILATVRATALASEEELLRTAQERLERVSAAGTTVCEVKSGYGLEASVEAKILRVTVELAKSEALTLYSTFLAHEIPVECRSGKRRENYIAGIVDFLPEARALGATACDVFCEPSVFTLGESRRILEAAKQNGLAVKAHVDELEYSGGASLVAELEGLSADHLWFTRPEDYAAMSAAGTVAVLLPGTSFYLNSPVKPDIHAMRQAGVTLAVATDHNPGSSPLVSQTQTMLLGCLQYGLSPEEAFCGATLGAAQALGGDLAATGSLLVWDCPDWRHLIYRGFDPPTMKMYRTWPIHSALGGFQG